MTYGLWGYIDFGDNETDLYPNLKFVVIKKVHDVQRFDDFIWLIHR